tara:strand:+ start:2376 stop:3545 length:1170 start_codon:yes stop_codon:yes gene_type:complete
MAITIVDLGKDIVATKRVLTATTDNVLAVEVKLLVLDTFGVIVYEASNQPDLGTSDSFTFEINHFLFRQFYETQFPLQASAVDERFDLVAFQFKFYEVEADGTETGTWIGVTPVEGILKQITFTHNIAQRFNKINSFDITDYYCDDTGNSTRKFLTSAPLAQNLWLNDVIYESVLKWSSTLGIIQQQFVLEEYDVNDVLLTTTKTSFANRTYFAIIELPYHNTVDVQITNTATAYALTYVEDIVGLAKRSEIRRYNIVSNCGNVKVEWINEFGKVDYFYFKGEQIKALSTNTSVYEKATPINPTNNDYGNRVFDNELSENWVLYTDSVSQDVIYWLSNMYLSKKVSVYIDGERFPVILNSNKLQYFRDINNINQISIPIVFANNVLGNN